LKKLEKHIVFVQQQFRINGFLKSALIAAIPAVILFGFEVSVWVVLIVFLLGLGISAYFLGIFKDNRKQAIQHLHEKFPGLEFSLELAEKKDRNLIESLQWERVNSQFRGDQTLIFHKKLLPFFLAFLVSFSVFGLKMLDWRQNTPQGKSSDLVNNSAEKADEKPVTLQETTVTITAPSYAGIKSQSQSDFEIKALMGSEITWELEFSNAENVQVLLVNSDGESLDFAGNAGKFSLKDKLNGSGIYAIQANQDGKMVFDSGFFPIEAIPDQSPVIVPTEKEVYKFHVKEDPKLLEVRAKISDDYLITQVYLVATLARGSGENVKFRENRIPIDKRNFQSSELRSVLDLNALDFKQGDELYYYWAALDNKSPEPNFSRSDTYFLKYLDSTAVSEADLAGMAIHVLPEYFRSQRQIIIDTEKLITQKKALKTQVYNSTSNEIGYDQKLLRLRYGQYLGEEFESGAGGGSVESGESGNILDGFEHKHDQEEENEGGGLIQSAAQTESEHTHEEEGGKNDEGDGLGSMLDAFLHNHESEEMNTFFEGSTKGILKMALEQMWQSELHLRLFEPEKAIPFQYKALELLKSVQQKSRVYVKRTGFDPPPIREEEKRLTGELKDLEQQILKEQAAINQQLAPLAGRILGILQQESLSQEDQMTIKSFGKLWTQRIQYSGMEDWSVLLLVQKMAAGTLEAEDAMDLRKKLYPYLANSKSLNPSYLPQQDLQKAFWKNLK
jgi:hypothetical protein